MRAIKTGLCLAALMTLPGLTGCASHGADTAPAAAWGEPRFAAWQETDPAYRFYPGDSFEVIVHSAPELSRTVEIGPDGRVALPLISDLMVAGRTDREIGDTIARAYAQNVLVNPMVEVRRAGLGPQNIIVGGEVNAPGLVEMTGPIGALEAVMLAGGFQNTAARGDVVVLRRAPGGDMMMRTVNLHDALRARQGADNIQIRRHDIIFVPRSTVAEVNLFVEQYVMGIVPLDQAMSFAIADAISGD
ncbi:MAG: polysaccharide biosynthesis/export family protein [Pseudomonadota bacterium]|jgi:polysaccharide export outer membrane protein|nr:polysaccharide biosynthesis/export family protein [Pseudomonadota bacterium]